MINAHVLCIWLVELFGPLLQMLGAKLDKLSLKRPLLNSIGSKEGKNRGKVTQVKCPCNLIVAQYSVLESANSSRNYV